MLEVNGNVWQASKQHLQNAQRQVDAAMDKYTWLQEYGNQLPGTVRVWMSDLFYGSKMTIDIEHEHLVAVRKLLGRLHVTGKELACRPSSEHPYGTVYVHVQSDDHPLVKFRYQRELGPQSRCKIEAKEYAPSTDYNLVCSVQ